MPARARNPVPPSLARSTFRRVSARKTTHTIPTESLPSRLTTPPINELLAAMVSSTFENLQNWSSKWRMWRDRTRVNNFAHHLKEAMEAHAWLVDETTAHSDKLTCREACEVLNIDQAWLVEKLYSSLDPEALQVLLSPKQAWHAIEECADANQRREQTRRETQTVEQTQDVVTVGA